MTLHLVSDRSRATARRRDARTVHDATPHGGTRRSSPPWCRAPLRISVDPRASSPIRRVPQGQVHPERRRSERRFARRGEHRGGRNGAHDGASVRRNWEGGRQSRSRTSSLNGPAGVGRPW
jgi:hypothetical protein